MHVECRQRKAGWPVELVNGAGGPAKGGFGHCDLSTLFRIGLLEWIVDAPLQSSMLQTAENCKELQGR